MVTRTAPLDGWQDALDGDAGRRRDPDGADAVTLELFRQIVAGEIDGAAGRAS